MPPGLDQPSQPRPSTEGRATSLEVPMHGRDDHRGMVVIVIVVMVVVVIMLMVVVMIVVMFVVMVVVMCMFVVLFVVVVVVIVLFMLIVMVMQGSPGHIHGYMHARGGVLCTRVP